MTGQLRNHMDCATDAFHPGHSTCVKSTAPAPLRPTRVLGMGLNPVDYVARSDWLRIMEEPNLGTWTDQTDPVGSVWDISMPFAWGKLVPKDPSFRFGAKHPGSPNDIIFFVKYIPFVSSFCSWCWWSKRHNYTPWRVRICLRPLYVQISTYC